jgi:hypothetical protein
VAHRFGTKFDCGAVEAEVKDRLPSVLESVSPTARHAVVGFPPAEFIDNRITGKAARAAIPGDGALFRQLRLMARLDRWGRSVTDLLATLQELEHLGVGFVSPTEGLDLTTPAGRAMAGLPAVFEFEREILREREVSASLHDPADT